MADIYEIEDIDGVRFNWNAFPVTRQEAENMSSPVGCLYTPLLAKDDLPVADYDRSNLPSNMLIGCYIYVEYGF